MSNLIILKNTYAIKKTKIQERLKDFRTFYNDSVSWFYEKNNMQLKPVNKAHNECIFEELSFCLMTANTSAALSMKAIDYIRPVLFKGSVEDIKKKLVEAKYRFPNVRAYFIVEARENFKNNFNFDFKKIFNSIKDIKELRDFFVKNVKGLGYKEASHFLRNIGFSRLAILDKHILKSMKEFNLIEEIPKTMNRKTYLDVEEKLIGFAKEIDINIDELDLLLWSMKTGNIMK